MKNRSLKPLGRLLAFLTFVMAAQCVLATVEPGCTYRISSKKFPGRSLFVRNSSSDLGTEVVLWTETDVPAQQWTVVAVNDVANALQCVYSGYYATPSSQTKGGHLRMGRSASSGRIVLEPVDEEAGIYHITPVSKKLHLAVAAGENGELPVWDEKSDDEGQLWLLEEVEPKTTFNTALRDEHMDLYLKKFCTSKGSNQRTFVGGGWGEAEQLEVLLDAYETTGNETYLKYATHVYNYFKNKVGDLWNKLVYTDEYKWYGHDFNDDVMWQIIAVARLGWLSGNQTYTTAAKKNFDIIYERAYIPFTGLMRWAENSGDPYGTNSCIAGPTEVAACYLGMSGCGEEYFEKARDLYAAQRYTLANNMQTGKVWDSVVWDPATQQVKSKNEWASTYNQGTMLGAACLLYDHYGDEQYLKDAQKIMQYTKKELCNAYGQVKVCQDESNGDLCGFKGILMRYVRRFTLDLCQPDYQAWLLKNAMLAYSNRSEKGLTGTGWLTKATPETTTNAFGCSTSASAVVNVPLGEVVKDAFDTLQAEAFDYHRGLVATTEQGRGGDRIIQVANGCWAQYDNVDFGEQTARSLQLELTAPTGTARGTVEVYFDRISDAPDGVFELKNLDASETWHTLLADITPVTGRHHLYLRFTASTTRAKVYRVDQFRFFTETADGVRTGVDDLQSAPFAEQDVAETYYDLLGRRLPAKPACGTFIVRRGSKSRLVVKGASSL